MIRLTLKLADKSDWLNHYDPQGAGVFVPTATPPQVNEQVRIDLTIDGGPRLILYGAVLWRRAEQDERIPAGVGVAISQNDSEKVNYLNGYVRGGLLDLRELRRLPLKLDAKFDASGESRSGRTRDINEEGVFVYTPKPLSHDARTTLIVNGPTPGGDNAVLPAIVTYVMDEEDGGPGMGLKFEFADSELYKRHVERIAAWEQLLVEGRLPEDVIA